MSKEYDSYLKKHRENNVKAYQWLANRFTDVAINKDLEILVNSHDHSKNLPDEYKAYDVHFYGNKNALDQESIQKDDDAYRKAWLFHINRSKHHWEHWIIPDYNEEDGIFVFEMIPMDDNSLFEMIIDWFSFSFAADNLFEIFDWYYENKNKMLLHPKTRIRVEHMLDAIRDMILKEENENE